MNRFENKYNCIEEELRALFLDEDEEVIQALFLDEGGEFDPNEDGWESVNLNPQSVFTITFSLQTRISSRKFEKFKKKIQTDLLPDLHLPEEILSISHRAAEIKLCFAHLPPTQSRQEIYYTCRLYLELLEIKGYNSNNYALDDEVSLGFYVTTLKKFFLPLILMILGTGFFSYIRMFSYNLIPADR